VYGLNVVVVVSAASGKELCVDDRSLINDRSLMINQKCLRR